MFKGLTINPYGIAGLVLIGLMILLRMFSVPVPDDSSTNPILYRLLQTVSDPYILFSIIPYVIFSLIVHRRLSPHSFSKHKMSSQERYILQNIFGGLQIAFILLILGLFLGLNNIVWQIVYYLVAVAIGLVVPFLVFSRSSPSDKTEKKQKELNF